MERSRGRTLWQGTVVGLIGGILSGIIGEGLYLVIHWLMPNITPYSSPALLVRSLSAVCVAFALKPLATERWWWAGLVLGASAALMLWLFPADAHSLLPFHWSGLTLLPAGLSGMMLREATEEGGA